MQNITDIVSFNRFDLRSLKPNKLFISHINPPEKEFKHIPHNKAEIFSNIFEKEIYFTSRVKKYFFSFAQFFRYMIDMNFLSELLSSLTDNTIFDTKYQAFFSIFVIFFS